MLSNSLNKGSMLKQYILHDLDLLLMISPYEKKKTTKKTKTKTLNWQIENKSLTIRHIVRSDDLCFHIKTFHVAYIYGEDSRYVTM